VVIILSMLFGAIVGALSVFTYIFPQSKQSQQASPPAQHTAVAEDPNEGCLGNLLGTVIAVKTWQYSNGAYQNDVSFLTEDGLTVVCAYPDHDLSAVLKVGAKMRSRGGERIIGLRPSEYVHDLKPKAVEKVKTK
jgi:hypothetical protein